MVKFKKEKVFFNALNQQVEDYFKKNNLKKTGNTHLYIKSIILIASAIVVYISLLTINFPTGIAIAMCCIFGFLQAGIGFNVMHDANHGSYSEKKWVNSLLGLSMNAMGSNAWMWKQKHNIIHHTYTNVDGVDDDIVKTKLLRMCPSQDQMKMHRYQYIYCTALYTLSSFMMIVTDFIKYFSKKILTTPLQKMSMQEHFLFWFSKIAYLFFYIILPSMILGFGPAILGFTIMHVFLGLTLATIFQLAHVVEKTHFQNGRFEDLHVEDEWAIHQVLTTADFATNSKIVSWYTGGLNFQVEHHLFPRISHIHYPAIQQFVKKTCDDFGIRYNNYPTFASAVKSHYRFMKQLGE